MTDLSNSIYRFYLEHFDELSFEKQCHFASRLYLWNQDNAAKNLLAKVRQEFTASDNPSAALRGVYDAAQTKPFNSSKNATHLRKPFFDSYPNLRAQVLVLFRLMFLRTLYGQDGTNSFSELCPKAKLEQTYNQLLADEKAVAILSTHAVNFLYLYTRVVLKDEGRLSPEIFIRIGHTMYDRNQPIHLQLLIYLYTHCIIGESLFYYRHLPDTYLPIYRQMLQELEDLISANFDKINMDNKFEYLVCAQILGQNSPLHARIQDEADKSLSDAGMFVIDRHNHNPQTANVDLDGSEHRNTLLILANRTYSPLG